MMRSKGRIAMSAATIVVALTASCGGSSLTALSSGDSGTTATTGARADSDSDNGPGAMPADRALCQRWTEEGDNVKLAPTDDFSSKPYAGGVSGFAVSPDEYLDKAALATLASFDPPLPPLAPSWLPNELRGRPVEVTGGSVPGGTATYSVVAAERGWWRPRGRHRILCYGGSPGCPPDERHEYRGLRSTGAHRAPLGCRRSGVDVVADRRAAGGIQRRRLPRELRGTACDRMISRCPFHALTATCLYSRGPPASEVARPQPAS